MNQDGANDDGWDRDPYDPQQAREWAALYPRIEQVLNRFGTKGYVRDGDYLLVDDNWGWRIHQVEFNRIELYRPEVIWALQDLLIGYPDWSISIRADIVGKEEWPGMGVVVYPSSIDDDLRREFLPSYFQTVSFDRNYRIDTAFPRTPK